MTPSDSIDKITMKSIREYSAGVAREFRPERIILFGSHADGSSNRDSDVDLMVIMQFEGKASDKSAEIRSRVAAPFPLDLLVRTPEKIRSRLAGGDCFIADILERGKVLYEATHAGVDRKGRRRLHGNAARVSRAKESRP